MKFLKNLTSTDSGDPSFKKMVALIMITLFLIDWIWVIVDPASSWITEAIEAKWSDTVIIAVQSTFTAMTVSALAVYGWAKAKGGA